MAATDPTSLLAGAAPYQSFDELPAQWVIVYLLGQIAGAPFNTMTSTQLLAQASQYQALSEMSSQWVIVYLLTQIQAGGGGGGGGGTAGVAGNYGGNSPLVGGGVAAATGTSLNFATDTSNSRLWIGWLGVWH